MQNKKISKTLTWMHQRDNYFTALTENSAQILKG